MNVAAIVLAAGQSSRMGVNKLLLKLGGKPVIHHILSKLGSIPTIVVLGHSPQALKDLVESCGVETVFNPDYKQGMYTSFQVGLQSLPEDVDAVFMVLSDTFGFKPEVLTRMVKAMTSEDGYIVSPMYDGKRGHPVLLGRRVLDDFMTLGEDETMKNVVNRYQSNHVYVESSFWTVMDMDTPEDYERIKKLWDE